MSNPNPPTLEESLAHLRTTDQFKVLMADLAGRREEAIDKLADADSEFKGRKQAAIVTVLTDLLHQFSGV